MARKSRVPALLLVLFLVCLGGVVSEAIVSRVTGRAPYSSSSSSFPPGFSSWDGSHTELVSKVKAAMHNPSSFEHVETRYEDDVAGTYHVIMKYRGTNGFGAVVTQYAEAITDSQGQVVTFTPRD